MWAGGQSLLRGALVFFCWFPMLGHSDFGDGADGVQRFRFRKRCEQLRGEQVLGKTTYTFHHEWAQLDCNFWTSRNVAGAETGTYVYRYLDYAALVQRMKALADLYPTLVRLRTAQDRYDLPTAGMCSEDMRGIQKAACRVWILEIGSEERHAADKPQVLLSGALHGNERIGPTAIVELATFLLGRYTLDPWVKLLLDTRTIVMVPAANGIGYFQNKREELGVDPNRDFAYDTSQQSCMRTIAARSLNEIWRSSIFSFAVTFHGGDNLLAFPWGDTAHCPGFPGACKGPHGEDAKLGIQKASWIAPDHTAMAQIAKFASDYAGPEAPSRERFRHGPLNDPKVIYPVGGGMEDWAYGASWTKGAVVCQPRELRGYQEHRTVYSDSTHRTANLLVETSNAKTPPEIELGHSGGILLAGSGPMSSSSLASAPALSPSRVDGRKVPGLAGKKAAVDASRSTDGHIPRNIRLCLIVIDMLQPYAEILGFVDSAAGEPGGTAALPLKPSGVAMSGSDVWVVWRIGGAFWIDDLAIECSGGDGNSWVGLGKCGLGGGEGMSGKDLRDARAPWLKIPECSQRASKLSAGEVCTVRGRVHSCAFLPDRSSQYLGTPALAWCQSASESARVCAQDRFLCAGLPAAWDGKEGPRTYMTLLTRSSASSPASAVRGFDPLRVRVRARLDQMWADPGRFEGRGDGSNEGHTRAESHWVQQRTNASWFKQNGDFQVRGHTDWYSAPAMLPALSTSPPPSRPASQSASASSPSSPAMPAGAVGRSAAGTIQPQDGERKDFASGHIAQGGLGSKALRGQARLAERDSVEGTGVIGVALPKGGRAHAAPGQGGRGMGRADTARQRQSHAEPHSPLHLLAVACAPLLFILFGAVRIVLRRVGRYRQTRAH